MPVAERAGVRSVPLDSRFPARRETDGEYHREQHDCHGQAAEE
jgi:hypothetical protein